MYTKSIRVVCAIIVKDELTLCVKRSNKMQLPNKWEFPGGKVEQNESDITSLKREIFEELGISIEIKCQLFSSEYEYSSNLKIELVPFICKWEDGKMTLKEHQDLRWLPKAKMLDLDWAEADVDIVNQYIQYRENS